MQSQVNPYGTTARLLKAEQKIGMSTLYLFMYSGLDTKSSLTIFRQTAVEEG